MTSVLPTVSETTPEVPQGPSPILTGTTGKLFFRKASDEPSTYLQTVNVTRQIGSADSFAVHVKGTFQPTWDHQVPILDTYIEIEEDDLKKQIEFLYSFENAYSENLHLTKLIRDGVFEVFMKKDNLIVYLGEFVIVDHDVQKTVDAALEIKNGVLCRYLHNAFTPVSELLKLRKEYLKIQ